MHSHTHQTPHAQLNLRGLHCPMPIIRCKATLQRLAAGESLQVTTDNLDATRDLLLLLNRGGARFLGWRHDADGFHFLIQKQFSLPRPQPKRATLSDGWNWLRERLSIPHTETC